MGTEGYVVVPDFFRASECSLHVLDEKVGHFSDGRRDSEFEFQISKTSEHISCGDLQSNVMPLSTTLTLQEKLERVFMELSKQSCS